MKLHCTVSLHCAISQLVILSYRINFLFMLQALKPQIVLYLVFFIQFYNLQLLMSRYSTTTTYNMFRETPISYCYKSAEIIKRRSTHMYTIYIHYINKWTTKQEYISIKYLYIVLLTLIVSIYIIISENTVHT